MLMRPPDPALATDADAERPHARLREIPYNYTSFSDREIVIRLLGEDAWQALLALRAERRTGRSARMLYEVLGDIWVVARNPYLQDDLLEDPKRRAALIARPQPPPRRDRQAAGALRGDAAQETDPAVRAQLEARDEKVAFLLARARGAVRRFAGEFEETAALRQRAMRRLARSTRRDNIQFDGLARVSHVTDATDWRVEYPFVVVYPDTEDEVAADRARLHRARAHDHSARRRDRLHRRRGAARQALGGDQHREARGAGCGRDGAARGVERDGADDPLRRGRGDETRDGSGRKRGLRFRRRPTSADASCIGGNVAMNAGGKKAVLWGTALDNLVSWRMVDPDGRWVEVTRLDHNLGKIHDAPVARFSIQRYARDGRTADGAPRVLEIPGRQFRKAGLGKDVTDKFLAGLPGVQKEGCDGIITSARFILHRMPQAMRTVCLEFFGQVRESVPSIVEIKDYLDAHPVAILAGLEHLDERYLKAVGYATKARQRRGRPKMVLIGDIVGDDEDEVARATSEVVRLANARGGEGFVAVSAETRRSSGSTARAPRRSRSTPTRSRSTRTSSFRSSGSATTPTASSASTSSCRSRTSSRCSTRWTSTSRAASRSTSTTRSCPPPSCSATGRRARGRSLASARERWQ